MSQTFLLPLCGIHTCVQFHDHRSNNNKVIMTDGSKEAMSNRVEKDFEYTTHNSFPFLYLLLK